MKKVSLILMLIAVYTTSTAQEIQTLFSNDNQTEKTFGGYGAPLIRASTINGEWGVMFGGKGGFIVNRTFAFGGLGMALMNQPGLMVDNLSGDTNTPAYLEMASGGVFFEYFFNMEKPIHFSIPLNLMGGGVTVLEETTNNEIESSGLFIIEPGVGVELNVSQHFIPALNVTYRQVVGSNLTNLDNQELSGLNIELVFKIGGFSTRAMYELFNQ